MEPAEVAVVPTPLPGTHAEVSAGVRLSENPAALEGQVDSLYRQIPTEVLVTFLIGVVAVSEMWFDASRGLLAGWGPLVVAVCAGRYGLFVAYKRRASGPIEPWLRRIALTALATGALWGLAGSVFFPAFSGEKQLFVALLMAGVLAAGIPAFSAVWWVYAIFGASIVAPFLFILFSFDNRLYIEVASLVFLFYLLNVTVAFRQSRVFAEGVRLRSDFERLAQDHAGLNAQLRDQIEELIGAQREIQASGRKLALFAERAPIAVFEMDANGTILEMNPAAETIFGYPAMALSGRNFVRALLPVDDPLAADGWWGAFVSAGQPVAGLRSRCLRHDGLEVMCELSLTPLVNDAGELVSVITQCQDITQQLEAERLKKEFTSTLSHELRTPLTSIIGSLQLINTGAMGDVDRDIADLTAVAERNGQRLLDLINDILDIEKIESGKLTLDMLPIALDSLVQDSLILNRGFADRFKIRVVLREAPPAVSVLGDPKRLLQVLTNLLSNAIKFSPEGGTVEVGVRLDQHQVCVSIEDRGPGIPTEFRTRIFSRFAQADSAFTRKKGGTGLGLAICKRLVELMGGDIGFRDREGGGSVFYFNMPYHTPMPSSAP